MIANPLVRFMEKRIKIVRKHSSAIIIILVILSIVGAIYGVIYFIIAQVTSLVNDIDSITASIQQLLNNASESFERIHAMLPGTVQEVLDESVKNLQETMKHVISETGTASLGGAASFIAKNIVEFALMFIITIISAYFFIKERDNLVEKLKNHLPESVIHSYNIVMDNLKIAVNGYLRAQFKLMAIITVILFLGLCIMRVRYSFLFAFLIAFLDFLPFFGTGAVLWPWAVIELFAGNIPRAICLLAIYLVCQIVRQVLQPKMVGDSIGISPLATLVFMFIGYRFYGALGMILGIPAGMILIKFYKLGMFDRIIKGFSLLIHDINEFRKF